MFMQLTLWSHFKIIGNRFFHHIQIKSWEKEAGENVTIKIKKGLRVEPTRIDDSNPYWVAFKNATEQL